MQIPGFQIVRQIGKGGMATVYLAIQESLDREVAIKVMSPFLAEDETFGERFMREARIVAKLTHPHIVAVYDVGTVEEQFYIAMQYSPGGDLKQKIAAGLNEQQAVIITQQIASALQYAHDKGYIHRDVKPANILFDQHGNACLTDFGVAKATSAATTNLTVAGSVIGTPTYMSPEQARGDAIDHRSDLYSLGVVFYEMLSGQPPYHGDSGVSIAIKHISEPVPQLSSAFTRYQDFINKLLNKNVQQRIQSGNEIIQELNNLYQFSSDSVTHIMQKVSSVVQPTGPLSGLVPSTANPPAPDQEATQITPPPSQPVSQPVLPAQPEPIASQPTPSAWLRFRWSIAVSLLFVVTAIAAYFVFEPEIKFGIQPNDTTSLEVKSDEALTRESLSNENKPVEPPPGDTTSTIAKSQPLDAEHPDTEPVQVKIAEFLRAAEQAYDNNNYVFPEDQSALSGFRKVLAIDPKNQSALNGIQRIGDHYLKYAQEATEKNNLFLAEQHLTQAQAVIPGDPRIAALKDDIKHAKQQNAASQKQRRQQNLTLANHTPEINKTDKPNTSKRSPNPKTKTPKRAADTQSVKTEKFVASKHAKKTPSTTSSKARKKTVLNTTHPSSKQSSNQSTKSGGNRPPTASVKTAKPEPLVQQTVQQIAQQKPPVAEKPAGVTQTAKVATLDTQKNGTAMTDAERKKRLERQVKELYRKGRSLLSRRGVTLEKIDQAHNYYKEIDTLSPNHKLAKRGYILVVRAYIRLATIEYRHKNYNDARDTVKKGLSVDRHNRRLISLQRRLKRAPKTNRSNH